MPVVEDNFGQTTTTRGGGGSLIGMREIEGRGRAVVALKPLKAGQIVLRDSPILVYSALPLALMMVQQQPHRICYCSNCFRFLQPSTTTVVSCSSCSESLFCSPNCRSIALATSHTPWACQALTRLRDHHSQLLDSAERQLQARFLVAAYNLSLVSPSAFRTLLSLQGGSAAASSSSHQPPPDSDDASLCLLHSLISSLCPPPPESCFGFSLELTALLLAKDKLNAFGLMEPFSEDRVDRSVRAYAIYPMASLFNHDCLPNACRFDYVDSTSTTTTVTEQHHQNNTDIIVRVIHDVPQGREICLSYFPVNLKYSERQRRLRDDYGFTCDCDRCKVEVNWSDNDEEDVGEGSEEVDMDDDDNNLDEEAAVMDEDLDQHMAGSGSETENAGVVNGEDEDFPHAYFFLRYMCDRNNCWGTLAPLPPSDASPSCILECNVCGNLKNCQVGVW